MKHMQAFCCVYLFNLFRNYKNITTYKKIKKNSEYVLIFICTITKRAYSVLQNASFGHTVDCRGGGKSRDSVSLIKTQLDV